MTMVSTGPISLGGTATTSGLNQSVNVELGRSGTATINMNESAVRTLAGVPSGAISMNNFYGKSNRVSISFTYTGNTQQASLNLAGIGGYIAGASDITVTVNPGVYLWSDNTGVPGLTLSGGTTGDTVNLVNNGFIIGRGGRGADPNNSNAGAGGSALSISRPTTINNTNGSAWVAGGGGGGASGNNTGGRFPRSGAGGGGGAGGAPGASGANASGGAGGGLNQRGGSVTIFGENQDNGGFAGGGGNTNDGSAGGGGGRILPGAPSPAGQGGGANNPGGYDSFGAGSGSAGGGGWGASGGTNTDIGRGGGGGGRAVQLNGNSVTWVAGNTSRVYGAVS